MKNKIVALFVLCMLCVGMASAQFSEEINKKWEERGINPQEVLDIREKMFLTQIYDIYFNYEEYKQKPIALEGMFDKVGNIVGVEDNRNMVYRRSPGCCGNDGFDGFVINYNGDLPKENDWVKVYGIVCMGSETDPIQGIYLDVVGIEVLPTRGEEFVAQ
ncbi:MAG: hypothetical protein SPL05_02415 [Eubacteriales bacterium]|nr:hypothetical protein [Eubacteriales bacterium]